MTTIYHFFFIPVSIGLALAVAIMETMYAVNKKPVYLKMAKFWGKIFLLSFAVGVVTGIIQEFQFGMNWSNYSRFMGDIFGAPLAIEALLAFFMESTFIGVWMFTWDRFKPGVHAIFIWLTWLGSTLSAIWILAANSFMQHPTGFEINKATGHVRLRSFMDVVANPQLWRAFPHVIFAAVMTGGMIILGMSAFGMLHKRTQQHDGDKVFFTKSIRFGAVVALVGAVFATGAGDLQTQFIIEDQPMKFAATEAIYEDTKDPAPWAVVSLINEKDKTAKSIEIPYMLSLLSYHKASGSVKGMNTVDKELHEQYDAKFGKDMNYYVPVNALFWSFRFMALSAAIAGLASILALWFTRKGKGDGTDADELPLAAVDHGRVHVRAVHRHHRRLAHHRARTLPVDRLRAADHRRRRLADRHRAGAAVHQHRLLPAVPAAGSGDDFLLAPSAVSRPGRRGRTAGQAVQGD
jgi:cytochrome d ubiquinol oxidase subunit I